MKTENILYSSKTKFLLLSLFIFSCNIITKNSKKECGFFKDFKFENNKGLKKIDTSISKTQNALTTLYYFVNCINDSFELVYVFLNYKTGNYLDIQNATTFRIYYRNKSMIRESDNYSRANGDYREYRFTNDTIDCIFTMNFDLPLPPPPQKAINIDEKARLIHIGYYNYKTKKNISLYGKISDSTNFKETLFDPIKFKNIFNNTEHLY